MAGKGTRMEGNQVITRLRSRVRPLIVAAAVLAAASGFHALLALAAEVSYEVIHRFVPFPEVKWTGSLVEGSDGNFYGTTEGTIFMLDLAGNLSTVYMGSVESIAPGRDGNLYGTTVELGAQSSRQSSIFKLDREGSLTTLHGNIFERSLYIRLQGTDGSLYGTAIENSKGQETTIFKSDPGGVSLRFSQELPWGFFGFGEQSLESRQVFPLVQGTDGNIYGATPRGGNNDYGTIFKLDPELATFATIRHSFTGFDGLEPSSLIQGADGNLYGTTLRGGENGGGTIFKLDPASSFTTIHSFAGIDGRGPSSLFQGTDGNLYGTTGGGQNPGTIFRLDREGKLEILHSAGPDGCLIQGSDGNLYWVTSYNGSLATIFKLDHRGTFTTIYSFSPHGWNPNALVQGNDGNLYGTTSEGGERFRGTIFRLGLGGNITTLHSFTGFDGSYPSRLIQGSDGNLYGTTREGGWSGIGTIFKLDRKGKLTTLHSFTGFDGLDPSSIFEGSDGGLYWLSGDNTYRCIFKLDREGNLSSIHGFAVVDGYPDVLIQGSDGSFYGTTADGGIRNAGTIFRLDRDGNETELHVFISGGGREDGERPFILIQGSDGNIYGATQYGGMDDGRGTIFRLDREGNFARLWSFQGLGGQYPSALIQGTDGNLYGTTKDGGAEVEGTIFKLLPSGWNFTTLHSFTGDDGYKPSTLIQGDDGNLYGTTSEGGQANAGVVFRLRLSSTALQHPGDSNLDGKVNISDVIHLLGLLFLGSPDSLPCGEGGAADPSNRALADWNGEAGVDLTDAVALLGWLFQGGPPHVLGTACRPIDGCPDACDVR